MSVMAVDDVSVRVANGCVQKDKEASKEEQREQVNRQGQLTNVTFVEFSSRADDIKAGLIDTFLNLELIDSNLYLARHLLKGRQSLPAVYGGQVIGQALAAASATVDDAYKPHSLHSYFIQTGSVHKPILYMIDRVSDRRSFCTRVVKAIQEGQAIFTCQVSFHKDEPDAVTHQHEMPKVTPPEELRDFREIIEDSLQDDMVTTAMKAMLKYKLNEMPPAFARIFEFRPVDRDTYIKGCVEGRIEPRSSMWLRTKENIGDDPRLHQCVAAYISDCSMLETAIKPHSRLFRPVDRDTYIKGCVEGRIEPRSSMWLRTKENIGDDPRLHQCVAAYISDCSMLETAIKPHSRLVPMFYIFFNQCLYAIIVSSSSLSYQSSSPISSIHRRFHPRLLIFFTFNAPK
uniref:Acyl_CoA_thio domain-containing protein n=1 Tax=Ascaris lumbricoides TaxID=6252 RepID=A0A0M3IAP5_ASCLU